ncbi:TetR/AcrR family transcriptional regulator [Paenibacillus flagellatus]|uniref:HTH tetR-type domain-containing protein n=1 Tax=Paenibacillus flagellatus TaxID=2211139 RepID=A0A2V5K410_9BACL|nr:TetR/AcrR family transcriptional regulator [Paenibacillus flagellatus]PYI52624.1 hypothetical protein DLM86_20880 [Paenibacillus flagellatus]
MLDRWFPAKESAGTKRKIIEAAIELFSRNGFSAVSVREITKQVGIKESALYNHYKTKDEILETIYAMFREDRRQHALPPIGKLDEIVKAVPPETFLLQGFESFKQTVGDPLLVNIWRILNIEQYRDSRARDIILEDVYKGTIGFLEAAFAKMIAYGTIKPLDPRMLAFEYQYPLFAVMTEYVLLQFDGRDTRELEERVERHIRAFIDRVKP